MLRVRSHAKINLYLDVLSKRRDGYHNIETIFQTVSLADELTFEPQKSEVSMTCSIASLETGPENLVMRAALLLREVAGCRAGARLHLAKNVPVAAGLAGGSGNAGAALVGLNRLWDLRLSDPSLHSLARQLGADVPYCLRGGTVAATGRGEIMTPLEPIAETWFVLLHPDLAISTKAVYTSPGLGLSAQQPFAGRTAAFREAIRQLAAHGPAYGLFNRLEGVVYRLHPDLAEWKQRLMDAGCLAALMSGSGPTVFGVCQSRPHAESVAARMVGIRRTMVHSTPIALEVDGVPPEPTRRL